MNFNKMYSQTASIICSLLLIAIICCLTKPSICQLLQQPLIHHHQQQQQSNNNHHHLLPQQVSGAVNSTAPATISSVEDNNIDNVANLNADQTTSPTGGGSAAKQKILAAQMHSHNLNKLQKYLSERQQELIKANPGSLLAVARALKMAIVECQYQMRHEPWDCPIYGYSIKPTDIFGKLMSRSFKETSFIHSLFSSAITHSITSSCSQSLISTCGRKYDTRDGGYREDIDFGSDFAKKFMEATHELATAPQSSQSATSVSTSTTNSNNNSIDKNLNNNIIATGSGGNGAAEHQQPATIGPMEPSRRDRKIRDLIDAHNDQVGRLHVLNGMRRECKCHGISGACTMQTCWLKIPPFREVASKLHDSLDQAVRVIYVAHNPTNRHKSLTSETVKKSNKKRSSVQPVNGLRSRSSSSSSPSTQSHLHESSNSLTSDTASILGSRRRGAKRHTNSDNGEESHSTLVNLNSGRAQPAQEGTGGWGDQLAPNSILARNTTVVKRRPIARSIGIAASTISPSKSDLLYYEESPDFCVPSERYNIKGTKGRTCSENPNASNNCDRLCCGRGYKTEVREEKYKCECQFQFCCKLNCNTCTRRKVIHKCL